MRPLSIIYLYQNCGLYLKAACINYFLSKLRLVFEGDLYLKAASIRENTVFNFFQYAICYGKRILTARWIYTHMHCVKSVRIRKFSGSCFPAFGLNTKRYSVSPRIQSECGKYGPEKLRIWTLFKQWCV